MASDKNQQEYQTASYLENKIKELHNNIRHVTQLAMNWFAFLVTINYFTIGWLAKGSGGDRPEMNIIWTVAYVFILQNGLGILGLTMVAWTSYQRAKRIKNYEELIINLTNAPKETKEVLMLPNTPTKLYNYIAAALIIVLISLIWAWINIGMHYSQ
jgi:hypothetical protein